VLRHPPFISGDPDIVSAVSWWYVPDSAQALLSYESTHLPRDFKWGQQGGVGSVAATSVIGHPVPGGTRPSKGSGYGAWYESWAPPGGTTALMVEIAAPGNGPAYVRVQASASWIPARPASERVPAGASVVVITAQPNMNKPHDVPGPVTVTDPAKVRQIVALTNGLNLDSGVLRYCPMETGQGITVTFLARLGGPALATASEQVPTCGTVSFVIGGERQPALSDRGSFTPDVLKIAGVKWAGWNA
jgi:hypothetical protein